MHELSIAESILDAVREELLRHPGGRPTRAGLRIGALSGVDVDSLSFCFEAVLKGTEWETLQLDIRACPQRRLCEDCGNDFQVVDYDPICPACSSSKTKLTSGDELDFDYLEVETDGTCEPEVKSAQ
jgi:hydrogenase nickel incorporation protein HypA/HybF